MNGAMSNTLRLRPVFELLERRFLLDGAPPEPLAIDLQAASDSGASETDDLTNIGTATVDITAARKGDTIGVFRSGAAIGQAAPVGGALYRYTLAAGDLREGLNDLTARACAGGLWSGDSPLLSVTLDTVGPRVIGASPDQVFNKDLIKHLAPLDQVHALQLVSEYCSGNKSSYYSYELNLVLKDGRRVNVIDHGNINRIRQDAQTLSNFLGKPVWNAL